MKSRGKNSFSLASLHYGKHRSSEPGRYSRTLFRRAEDRANGNYANKPAWPDLTGLRSARRALDGGGAAHLDSPARPRAAPPLKPALGVVEQHGFDVTITYIQRSIKRATAPQKEAHELHINYYYLPVTNGQDKRRPQLTWNCRTG